MGEIDERGIYIHRIPFSSCPDVEGIIVINSNNKQLNDFVEKEIRQLLRDIYYGRCDFEL